MIVIHNVFVRMPRSPIASDLQKSIDENNYLNDKSFKTLDVNANCCAASVASKQHYKQDLRKIYRRGDEFSN